MKKIYSKILIASLFMAIVNTATGQQSNIPQDASEYPYWIEMMQDPDANYYETVEAFNEYWADRPERKGKGYNPFKRWEWYMKFKINEDGSKRVRGEDRKVYYDYISSYKAKLNSDGDWINLGPIDLPSSPYEFWGNGRLNAIAFHPTDPDKIYVGAPSGGLWVSEDGGLSWDILTDDQPTLGVSSVIVDHSNPDVIYLGSGDRDAGDADGLGVFKSTDGGASWTQINSNMGNATVGRMVQDPIQASTILAATSNGIFKTTDGGTNWSMKQSGGFKDILLKPGMPATLYAVKGGDFFTSDDGGETWIEVISGLPSNAYRGVIAVSDANPEYVYFLGSTSNAFLGLYRSTDGGQNFTLMSDSPNILGWACTGGSGGQAWYDLDIAADPLDADIIYAGGINCWKSNDGGISWTMVSNQVGECNAWAVHADLHVLEWSPLNGMLYAGNDGGIWWTANGGASWTRITNGLAIGQQYKMGQSKLLSYHTITGYQDNGISTYHGNEWIQTDMYADGMEAAMDIADTTLSYGCMQYGRMYRYVNDKVGDLIAGQGIAGIDENGAWVTPFTQHEYDQDIMFIGYTNLWRSENLTNQSPTWQKISENLGGSSKISVVEHSPADPDIFYFVKPSGKVFRSDDIQDANPNYIDLSSFLPYSGTPSDLEAHPSDPDVLYMALSQHVYRSADRGQSWEDITGTLPDVSTNDIAYYNRGSNDALYVATNVGVFFRDNTMDDWIMFSDGLPAAILATEVEIYHDADNQENDMIRISSYGRGLWESPPYYVEPAVNFMASDTTPAAGCPIDFMDLSSGYPSNWEWTFEGGLPASSIEQYPEGILYETPGSYYVKLLASNPVGSDSLIKIAYITVGGATTPSAHFIASDTISCPNTPVVFTDLSEDCPTSWEWVFDPETVSFVEGTSDTSQNPVVEFLTNGTYSVSLIATNESGSNTLTRDDYILVGGYSLPFIEDFSDISFGDMEWSIVNLDGQNTWENHYIEWEDNETMRMRNWGYFNMEERDQLISPPININGYGGVFLHFNHAYAQRSTIVDSLIIYISEDCGSTWTRIYENGPDGSGVFATAENTGYSFEPGDEEDWCGSGYGADCISISLEDWIESGTIRLMFENYNGFGNNLYLDNILVDFTYGLGETDPSSHHLTIYPNPNNGNFTLRFNEYQTAGTINIYDLMGHKVFETAFRSGEDQIDLDLGDAGKGVFIVEVITEDDARRARVIVQ